MHRQTLAEARATVLDPARVNLHPALMASAWAQLKQARGQSVRHDILFPAHIITRATPPEPATETAQTIQARAADHIRRIVATRFPTGGAA